MFTNRSVLESSEGSVWKYIFTKDNAVAEAVLYKYEEFYKRTVICCSVMSGCPVGCAFCGTGAEFIRNLTANEIVQQIQEILEDKGISDINTKASRFQIMFMSMGEPMLNWAEVEKAIIELHKVYPNAELLISTIGIDSDKTFSKIVELSKRIDKIGLQFSIHKSTDTSRNELIPFNNKMNLRKIRDAGVVWWNETGRKPYLNYCIDGLNDTEEDFENLSALFSPVVFNFTFSVVCSADENMKEKGFKELDVISKFSNQFIQLGYNVRMFNPAGQDDIGGGCGQLWYVQEWLRNNKKYKGGYKMNNFEQTLNDRLPGMAESHIEGWGSRYEDKDKDMVEYDLSVNHDDSLEVEIIEEELERELTDEERDIVSEGFIEEVLNQLF